MNMQCHNKCKLCEREEDNNHVFQCPKRGTWRAEFIDKLRRHLNGHRTAADIQTAIVRNMTAWLNMAAEPAMNSCQNRIGWGGFFRGFIAVEFSEGQEHLYRYQELPSKKFSGALWAQRLIEFMWQESQMLWKERCKEVHEEAGHRQSARELQEARVKIRSMYANKGQLLAADRDLLPGRVEEQLAQEPHQIVQFVRTTYDIFQF